MSTLFKLFLILCLVGNNIGYAQTLSVTYKSIIFDEEAGYFLYSDNELVTNEIESLYYTASKDSTIYTNEGTFTSGKSVGIRVRQYKNLIEKTAVSSQSSIGKILYDSNYEINWNLVSEYKKILGYNCQLAQGYFRGRNYKIYFTTELPYKNGPYKFDGLPGLVLEVRSDDGCVNIKADGIKNTFDCIENPYVNSPKKIVSWDEFIAEYTELYLKILSYRPISEGDIEFTTSIPSREIEILVKNK